MHRALLHLSGIMLIVAGCRPGPPPEDASEPPPAAVDVAEDTLATGTPAITVAHISNIHPERFPHGAHRTVDCTTCHERIPGHATHASLACARCHDAPTSAQAHPTTAECMACHHGPAQTHECVDCHGDRLPASREVAITANFTVRTGPAPMTLPFDHARHAPLGCRTCHEQAGVIAPRECTRCHDSHHTEDRRCLTCHTTDAIALHDRQAHTGCGGAGCHRDAVVTSLRQSRSVCLVCHRQQENHEPGRDCALCHLFGGSGAASTEPPLARSVR